MNELYHLLVRTIGSNNCTTKRVALRNDLSKGRRMMTNRQRFHLPILPI
ncbi:hypothetical protein LR69_02291 [Geobacillus sp. BCO2]|nr:hypothetical protein LR69_02291 [Geobacillus sp. BCO2]